MALNKSAARLGFFADVAAGSRFFTPSPSRFPLNPSIRTGQCVIRGLRLERRDKQLRHQVVKMTIWRLRLSSRPLVTFSLIFWILIQFDFHLRGVSLIVRHPLKIKKLVPKGNFFQICSLVLPTDQKYCTSRGTCLRTHYGGR